MGDFSIEARMGLDVSEFEAGIGGAQKTLSKFQGAINSVVGAFGVGRMAAFVKGAGDMAEQILNTSDSLDVGTDFLQDWNRTADLAGIGAERATLAIEKLSQKIGEGAESFAKYKIALADSGGMRSTEAVLRDVAALINSTKDGSERAAIAVEFFGKQGAKLLPLIAQINSLESGFRLTREELKSLDDAGDALTRLGKDAQIGGAMILNFFTRDIPSAMGEFFEYLVNAESRIGQTLGRSFDRAAYMAERAKKLARIDALAGMTQKQAESFVGTYSTAEQREAIKKSMQTLAQKEEQFRVSQLSDEERLTELYVEREELQRAMSIHNERSLEYITAQQKLAEKNLEIRKKESEIAKTNAELAEREKKAHADKVKSLNEAMVSGSRNLETSAAEALKFGETELQDMVINRRRNPALWAAQQNLWKAQRMEDEARRMFATGGGESDVEARRKFEAAQELKAAIPYLKEDPFTRLIKEGKDRSNELHRLLTGEAGQKIQAQILGAP